jgi:predicted small lipoprotein YifL
MLKKLAVLCVVLGLGLSLAGCGNKKAEMPKDQVAPPTEKAANATVEPIEAPQ